MMTHEQKTRLGIFLSLATVIFVAVAGFFILPKLRDPARSIRSSSATSPSTASSSARS